MREESDDIGGDRSKESGPIEDPAMRGRTRIWAGKSKQLQAQGTGYKVKTIKENYLFLYALRLTTQSAKRRAQSEKL